MAKFEPLYLRFWKHVDKSGECWLWTATRSSDGYGRVRVQRPKRTDLNAHRVSWELAYGPIPSGQHVLHHCDNPPCVRPDHLFLGTNADNVADKVAKGRTADTRGERNHKAKLTAEQVAVIRAEWTAGAIGRPIGRSKTAELAERFGVTKSSIYHVARGWTWRK
jgi:hypothetical protein